MTQVSTSCSWGKAAPYHSLNHDNGRASLSNVDSSRIVDNVVLVDELRGATVEEYTNEFFQSYIDDFNAKQKRADRKIKEPFVDYFSKQKNSSNELIFEEVIQIGNGSDLGFQYYNAQTNQEKEALHRFFTAQYKKTIDEFQHRWPQLKVVYAVIHFDEPNGTPHMHLGLQPIAYTKNKLGISISKSSAFEQSALERYESLPKSIVEIIDGNLRAMGFEIAPKGHGAKHEAPNPSLAVARRQLHDQEQAILSTPPHEIETSKSFGKTVVKNPEALKTLEKQVQLLSYKCKALESENSSLKAKVAQLGVKGQESEKFRTELENVALQLFNGQSSNIEILNRLMATYGFIDSTVKDFQSRFTATRQGERINDYKKSKAKTFDIDH